MPSIRERTVAEGRGVRAERDLAEAASDFNLLELLKARGNPDAARMLAKLEARLAKEFACYLDMAIGGELRYAINHLGKEALPGELACFFREIHPAERGMAWLVWNVIRRVLGLRALELAAELFRTPGWRDAAADEPRPGLLKGHTRPERERSVGVHAHSVRYSGLNSA